MNAIHAVPTPGIKPHDVDPETYAILNAVKKNPSLEFLHAKVPVLSTLPDATLNELYHAVRVRLNLPRPDFDTLFREYRAATQPTLHEGRRLIRVSDRLLDESSDEATQALLAANEPPVLFMRAGGLAVVQRDEQGRASIARVDPLLLRARLARVAAFCTANRNGRTTLCAPPVDLVQNILVSERNPFPALLGITNIPPLHQDGVICTEPGYDAATQMYFQPEPGFQLGEVSDAATPEAAARAAGFLKAELLSDFPFESDADGANALAALITPMLRPCFGFKSPLFAFDAPSPGSGKGLLASVIAVATMGERPGTNPLPESEAEMRKTVTAFLESDTRIVVFDNVDRTLRSAVLAGLLTCDVWSDRLLGLSKKFTGPNSAVWFATGNNMGFVRELTRRVCRIRLDPKTAHPEKRKGFKRPDEELLDWAQQNRGEVVAAVLKMARAWIMAGRPKAHVPTFGSFNGWAQTVGGILGFAGVQGFLGNLSQVRAEADEESAEWETFLTVWARTFGERGVTAREVADTFQNRELLLYLPDDLSEYASGLEGARGGYVKRLGKSLARRVGTRFGDRELRIERGGEDSHTKLTLWRAAGNLDGLTSGSTEATGA